MTGHGHSTIYYDAECAFCRAAVTFVRRRDRRGRFRLIPLASDEATARFGPAACACDTLRLVDAAGAHERSTAALRIAARLPAPWSWLRHLARVPRAWRDAVYDLVARHRHRWPAGPAGPA